MVSDPQPNPSPVSVLPSPVTKAALKSMLAGLGKDSFKVIRRALNTRDNKSRNQRLQVAQWVIEHIIGKPSQSIEADLTVEHNLNITHALDTFHLDELKLLLEAVKATGMRAKETIALPEALGTEREKVE